MRIPRHPIPALLALLLATDARADDPVVSQGGPLPQTVGDCEAPLRRGLSPRQGTLKARATTTLQPTSTRYAASNAVDGDPKTAWVEGEDGDGLGARVLLESVDGTPIAWPTAGIAVTMGYAKSEATWTENGRPTRLRLTARLADPEYAATPRVFDLVAAPGLPPLTPTFFALGCVCNQDMSCSEGFTSLEFEIVAIDAGTKYRDTAISDVVLYDAN